MPLFLVGSLHGDQFRWKMVEAGNRIEVPHLARKEAPCKPVVILDEDETKTLVKWFEEEKKEAKPSGA